MPTSSVASTETPPKLPKLGGSTIRKRISKTEITPRTVTTVLIGTVGSYGESARRRPTITNAATIVIE